MYLDYLFYLNLLKEAERNKQICVLIVGIVIVLCMGIIIEELKKRCNKNTNI